MRRAALMLTGALVAACAPLAGSPGLQPQAALAAALQARQVICAAAAAPPLPAASALPMPGRQPAPSPEAWADQWIELAGLAAQSEETPAELDELAAHLVRMATDARALAASKRKGHDLMAPTKAAP